MKQALLAALLALLTALRSSAQEQAIVHQGEIGISAGTSQYFGDLNPNPRFNTPNIATSIFFRKAFGEYVALRFAGTYTFLAYSDKLNSYNEVMYSRNLSFNTNIWEGTVQGDFNFFKYVPGSETHRFTPYITLGLGIFTYNPYTYYQGQKVFLRPLGTEGQGSEAYPNRKTYGSMAICFPVGVGVKYSLNRLFNIGLEVLYRFTTTDYIDDISSTYAPNAQPHYLPNGQPTAWYALEDRSYETGSPIGIQGRQRGFTNQPDSYLTAQLTFSVNLFSYECPSAK